MRGTMQQVKCECNIAMLTSELFRKVNAAQERQYLKLNSSFLHHEWCEGGGNNNLLKPALSLSFTIISR